jgi:hypothetical protein
MCEWGLVVLASKYDVLKRTAGPPASRKDDNIFGIPHSLFAGKQVAEKVHLWRELRRPGTKALVFAGFFVGLKPHAHPRYTNDGVFPQWLELLWN